MKLNKKYYMNLRKLVMMQSILTIFLSCIISFSLVIVCVKLFHDGPLTLEYLMLSCLVVCGLSVIFGGIFTYFTSSKISEPLEKLTVNASEIAKGNFDVQLTRPKNKLYYVSEIDNLEKHFDKMILELRSMDYMQKDFISSVSHEFKTPIAAITGFSELLQDKNISEEDKSEYLEFINQESLKLADLCEKILHISKLENQHITKYRENVRVDEQIRRAIIMLNQKWRNKEIDYNLNLPETSITSSASLLMHIWINIIDNAIKYSKKDLEISVNIVDLKNEIEVVIKDNGVGISEENLSRIFEKFYQVDDSHTYQGSGLGLSIVKRIIEILSGSIEYRSVLDEGTTVLIKLPKK